MSNTKIIGAVVVVALAGAWIAWLSNGSATTAMVTPPDTTATSTKPIIVDRRKYADGTYTASGAYAAPSGGEQVEVTLTLANDIVTNAVFVGKATQPTSAFMQERFKAGFTEQVVGKSIDSISLTVVNGSSLTHGGFMNALAKIKTQALRTTRP